MLKWKRKTLEKKIHGWSQGMAESTLGWGGLSTSTNSRDISLGTLNLSCDVDKAFCNQVLSAAMLTLKGSHYCINSTGKTLNTPCKYPTTISVLQILSQEGLQRCSYLLGSVGAEGEREHRMTLGLSGASRKQVLGPYN